jgi:hypothetical protein
MAMKLHKRTIIALCSFCFHLVAGVSCGVPSGNTQAGCKEPCPNVDYSDIRFENLDASTIYIKIGQSNSGDEQAVASMTNGVIAGHTQLNLAFENDKFNHFYFFSNLGYTNLLGKLIIKNTQPLYSSFCVVGIRNESDFSPPRGAIQILSLKDRLVCFRRTATKEWEEQDPAKLAADALGRCGKMDVHSAPADHFSHMYFYTPPSNCPGVNASNLMSQIIVRNSETAKISISSITLR